MLPSTLRHGSQRVRHGSLSQNGGQPTPRTSLNGAPRGLTRSRPPSRAVSTSGSASQDAAPAQPAQQEVKVTLKQPVGIIFAQQEGGPVFVETLVAGGVAEKTGLIQPGDVLARCSSVMLKSGRQADKEGYGDFVYDNWERVEFSCEGQDFKTVMSALKSNNPRWGFNDVSLVFVRPQPPAASQ